MESLMRSFLKKQKTLSLTLVFSVAASFLWLTPSHAEPFEGRWQIHGIQCGDTTFEVKLLEMLYSGYDYIFDLVLSQETGEIWLTHSSEHCDFKISRSKEGHLKLETPKELEGISFSPFGVWHEFTTQSNRLTLTPNEDQRLKDFCNHIDPKSSRGSWIFTATSS